MEVDEVTHQHQVPDIQVLIPEVREIERRRRTRLATRSFLVVVVVLATNHDCSACRPRHPPRPGDAAGRQLSVTRRVLGRWVEGHAGVCQRCLTDSFSHRALVGRPVARRRKPEDLIAR